MTRRLLRDPRLPVVWAMLVCFWSAAPIVRAQECANAYTPWVGAYTLDAGNIGAVFGRDLVLGRDGRVLHCGIFYGTSDLDPTFGVSEHTSLGESDAFVVKLNADGFYGWTYTIGGPELVDATAVTFDYTNRRRFGGEILVAGSFRGTVNFDSTGAGDVRAAVGDANAFVSRLDEDGTYLSTITFGEGTFRVIPTAITIDRSGALIIVGSFGGTADFDPGPGEDEQIAFGNDIFVTKLHADGSYGWTRHVGAFATFNLALAVGCDAKGNIYVAGTFRGTVDFDPGPGADFHTVMGFIEDTFITKLYPDGSYAWTRTYPDRPPDSISGIMAVDDDGNVYLSGGFVDTMDFDPTEGVDVHKSIGTGAMFVTKLHSDGSYGGTWTAGGAAGGVGGRGVAVDSTGNVYATGSFNGIVDFDPGPGFDVHLSRGQSDVFVTRLGADGSYGWTHTFGSFDSQQARHVAVDADGNVFTQGFYRNYLHGVVDFDPSCEVLEREVGLPGGAATFISNLTCFTPSADFDGDGFTDLRDLAAYQNCFTGPRRRIPPDCPDGCATFDFAPDSTINLLDLPDVGGTLTGP